MKLSVIIPFYNSGEFLPRLEKTMHKQVVACRDTQLELDVVVVDDASHSEQSELIRIAAMKNGWTLVQLSENTGPGGARNAGIEAAKGEYLIFLDSDDELVEGALVKLAAAVVEKPCEILLFDFTIINTAGERDYHMLPRQSTTLSYVHPEYALAFARGATSGKMYRADFVHKYKLHFGSGLRHEDTVFTKSSLAWAEQVAYLPESLYRYHIREGSLITNSSNASFESSFAAFEQIVKIVGGRRHAEMEYVYIVEVIISCVMKFYSLKVTRRDAEILFSRFDSEYPHWSMNQYLSEAGIRYRLYAALSAMHSYFGLKMVSFAETLMRKLMCRNY